MGEKIKLVVLKILATIFSIFLFLSAAAQQTDTVTVHFEFDRSEITGAAGVTLDSIFSLSKTRGLQHILLYGHCDFKGSDRYNDSLSQMRIQSVKEYLSAKGMAAELFREEIPFGERRPLAGGYSDEARAINRRVELVMTFAAEPVAAAPPRPAEKPTLREIMKDTATKTGVSLVLENLNFIGGRHQLLSESLPVLDELLLALQENPTVKIEIQGYVCCTEGDQDGFDWDLGTNDLSVQRAKAIYNFLVQKGVDSSRLSYRGFGGARKIFPYERNEYERSRNRRVELKITSK